MQHRVVRLGRGRLLPPSRSRRRFPSVPAPAERLTAPAGECYRRDDGADYRGTVKTTKDGVECQALLPAMLGRPQPCSLPHPPSRVPQSWSEQEPQQHTRRTRTTRAPAWAATRSAATQTASRLHLCLLLPPASSPPAFQVKQGRGATQSTSGYAGTTATSASLRPEPATRHRRRRRRRPRRSPPPPPPPPPSPPPRPPPPLPCSSECKAMLGGDGVCDAACNTTSCLWDAGDCKTCSRAC